MGLRVLMQGGELLPMPAMTIGRSIYDCVVQTCWLVDVEVSFEQRMARWAGRMLDETQESPHVLDTFQENVAAQERDRLVSGRQTAKRLMTRAGFSLTAKGAERAQDTRQVTYGGAKSVLRPNVALEGPRFVPNQQSLWPLFSGAAHGRGWLVAGLEEGDPRELVVATVAPLLDVSDALVIELSRYVGMDPRPIVDKTHLHRRTLTIRVRPGGAAQTADGYRQAGGAPPLPKPHEGAIEAPL